jgi:hypothetical protein
MLLAQRTVANLCSTGQAQLAAMLQLCRKGPPLQPGQFNSQTCARTPAAIDALTVAHHALHDMASH